MKKYLRVFVIVFAVILQVSACGKKPSTWQEQYDLGVRYLSEGHYEEAIIAFTAAIEIDPNRPEAYIGRGDAYVGSGKTDDNLAAALADYTKALELDENNQDVYIKIADIQIEQGDINQANDTLRRAEERYGATGEIANRQDVVRTRKYRNFCDDAAQSISDGEAEMAVSLYTAAIEADDKPAEAYIGRGAAYLMLGESNDNLDAALSDLKSAMERDDDNAAIYTKLADVYIQQGDVDSLLEILDQASEKFGETEDIVLREEQAEELQRSKMPRVMQVLVSSIWDASVQTTECFVFFPDGQCLSLQGAELAMGWYPYEYQYSVDDSSVQIVMDDGWTTTWTLNGNGDGFTHIISEYDYTTELDIDPIAPQDFFRHLATYEMEESERPGYWNELLNLVVLYKQKNATGNRAAAIQQDQDEWRKNLNQRIAEEGIDTDSPLGVAWILFQTKARVYALLDLQLTESEPPYVPAVSVEEATKIAEEFWDFTPGTTSPETGYELMVSYMGEVMHEGKLYYSFTLRWWVEDHPSTIDYLYVDAQAGDCTQDFMGW